MERKKYIKIGSIVKCTDSYIGGDSYSIGQDEGLVKYGIVIGHDNNSDMYRIYFGDQSSFIGIREKFVETTSHTTPELEQKKELVIEDIKAGNVDPFILYGDILTKDVCLKYNVNRGFVDIDEHGVPFIRHDLEWVRK